MKILLPEPDASSAAQAEPRSERAEFYFSESMRLGIREVAARFDVSGNEVVLHCLDYALSSPVVLSLIEDAVATMKALGPSPLEKADAARSGRSEHKLTPSVKRRLEAAAERYDTGEKKLARLCVQHTLLDPRLHRLIQTAAEARNGKRLGRTVRMKQEDAHRAA